MSVLMNTEADPADHQKWVDAQNRKDYIDRLCKTNLREMEELAKLDPTSAADICFEILEKLAYPVDQMDEAE